MDWHTAFLLQAKSDYQILHMLLDVEGTPECHRLHYLQMSTEKLAKGLLTKPNGPRPAKTHKAFLTFLRISKGRADVQRVCGFKDQKRFVTYINGLLSIAKTVEDLSPEGDDHPNPEYPWEVGGVVHSPLEYPFTDVALSNPKMLKLQQFVDNCFELA